MYETISLKEEAGKGLYVKLEMSEVGKTEGKNNYMEVLYFS